MAHAAAGAVLHFGVLHVVARLGEESVIARMIKVHVRDDHVFDAVGIDPDHLQSFFHRTKQGALSFRRARRVEAGVKHKASLRADYGPDKIIKWHGTVVRIAAKKIVRSCSMMMTVSDCE